MQKTEFDTKEMTDVAIIGAGPYGLSIAAHLAAREVDFRIFGRPMSSWSEHMPKGMQLKSEGFASSLSHPRGEFTLGDYCRNEGIPYKDVNLPVNLETFIAYGCAFQKKYVPNLEQKLVVSVEQVSEGFELVLDNHEKVLARRVVVATGITDLAYIPEMLQGFSSEYVSHSYEQSETQHLRGKRVAVIGAGASALDLATLLHENGANVEVIARSPRIRFHDPPPPKRSLMTRLRWPITAIGPGWDLMFLVRAPGLFRLLPEGVRLSRVRKTLGPAPGWFIRDRIANKVPFHLGVEIASANLANGRIQLGLKKGTGPVSTIEFDHVIAGTGYRVDLNHLGYLNSDLRQKIQLTGGAPRLSANFESTVLGLYFVGFSAMNAFGPFLRFACGAGFAAERVAKHLSRQRRTISIRTTQVAKSYGDD